MRILLVVANPNPGSFTHRLAARAIGVIEGCGHEAILSDLYADGFDPVASRHDFETVALGERFDYQLEQRYAHAHRGFSAELRREQRKVADADAYVFVFPLWWGSVPAIMKGWFDRVLAAGFAYDDGCRYETGLFAGRAGLIGVATGGSSRRFVEGRSHGSISQVLWPVQHGVLEYLGLETLEPFVAYGTARKPEAVQAEALDDWERRIRELCALEPRLHRGPAGAPEPVGCAPI